MCKGPIDTKKNIKQCLRDANTQFLVAMLEDWSKYHTSNAVKMQQCINEVLTERKGK